MKQNIFRKGILGLAMAASFALTAAPALAQSSDGLAGTWVATVTIVDCSNQNPVFSFPIMYTYLKEGALIGAAGLSAQGPLQGAWQPIQGSGNRRFTETLWVFTFNPDGTLFGSNKITAHITLGNDRLHFTSTATVQLFDSSGHQVGAGCATEAAQRLQ